MKWLVVFLCLATAAWADRPPITQAVGLDEHLDGQLPLSAPFVDETGRRVTLGSFFGTQPVVLVFAWYECPGLCSEVQNGVVQCITDQPLVPGKDFQVVTISINPKDTPELAAERKRLTVSRYGSGGEGFHYLTGDARAVATAAGFRYVYDAKTQQYGHPAGIMVCTPQGRLARYLYGVRYSSRDLKFALEEASHGRIGSPAIRLALLCFQYDPSTGKYGLAIMRILRVSGAMTFLSLGLFAWRHRG
ncbi:MAG TPA: SCO family protein [Candidatus Xenobia bacterium]|jgi:protein SCO1/2